MSLLNEYIIKRMSGNELEAELRRLISEYNKLRGTYLFVYAAAIGKPIPSIAMEQADFYVFHDLLSDKKNLNKVDIYLETPGGSGETAEEIVEFLHNNFDTVSFVISGEAKSAGTILVLSGDEIMMTETGSLGPIDAQVKIGRSVVSAYDYIEWVNEKRKEAEDKGSLNPFDATMVAQITPGELSGVFHALEYAKDLVIEWLVKYKFKKWDVTETRQMPVTEDFKRARADEIAKELTNHSKWRLHGRSLKRYDLENLLRIKRVEDDPKLCDLVYRIQIVCRLLFDTTTTFKIFATEDAKIFRQATTANIPVQRLPVGAPRADVVEIDQKCPQCGTVHKIYGKFAHNPKIDKELTAKGIKPFPKDNKVKCKCGFEMDISGLRNQIESDLGRKIIV